MYKQKWDSYEQAFYKNWEQQQRAELMKYSGDTDKNPVEKSNRLNYEVRNQMLTGDRRIEMGILAMRQRNRYKQVKKLGLKVPDEYLRIHGVKTLPKTTQDALVQYPETILEDSSFEDDEVVLQKYKYDTLKYIVAQDNQKCQ